MLGNGLCSAGGAGRGDIAATLTGLGTYGAAHVGLGALEFSSFSSCSTNAASVVIILFLAEFMVVNLGSFWC